MAKKKFVVGKLEKTLENLFIPHFVQRETHVEWPRRELGTPTVGGERLTHCATWPRDSWIMPNRLKLLVCWGRTKESVQFRGLSKGFVTVSFLRWGVVNLSTNPQAGGPPLKLSATAYSTYSQLSSISGGCIPYPQPGDAPCREVRDPQI